jgi:hypothetical protein
MWGRSEFRKTMADFSDKYFRDLTFLIVGWMIALAVAGLALLFLGGAVFG